MPKSRLFILAVDHLNSNVNLSAIARAASSFGVTRLITCGQSKLARTSAAFLPPREQAAMTPGTSLDLVQIAKIAREAKAILKPEEHRTMAPVLKKLKAKGYRIVALEQTTTSVPLFDFKFKEKTVLVVGNERKGLSETVLRVADDCVEIPIYALPHSYNVSTATAMALYEYCKQHRPKQLRKTAAASEIAKQQPTAETQTQKRM